MLATRERRCARHAGTTLCSFIGPGVNLRIVSCTASRLLVTAFAAYLVGGISHDAVLTWAVVVLAVAAVLVWSRRRSDGRPLGPCDVRCSTKRGADLGVRAVSQVGASPGPCGRPVDEPAGVNEGVR